MKGMEKISYDKDFIALREIYSVQKHRHWTCLASHERCIRRLAEKIDEIITKSSFSSTDKKKGGIE